MKRILLLDADGVLIPKEGYFSTRYATSFAVPVEKIMPFFQNEFRDCQLGIKDLKETLSRYVVDWQWQGSIDELLQFWFEDGSVPDPEIMTYVQNARNNGVKCYLATDQERYRAEYLRTTFGLAERLDGFFFSYELGVSKNEKAYWEKALVILGNPDPADVEFWDDDMENVVTAKTAGIDARFFTNFEDFKNAVRK